jgi:arylsulfatase
LGKWKLVSKADKQNSFKWDQFEEIPVDGWELFDMEADRTETKDVATDYPHIVAKLSKMWVDWAKRTGAIPRPG